MLQENAKVSNFTFHHFDPDSIQFTTRKTLTEVKPSIKRTVEYNLCYLTKKNEKDKRFCRHKDKVTHYQYMLLYF